MPHDPAGRHPAGSSPDAGVRRITDDPDHPVPAGVVSGPPAERVRCLAA
ncbi:hypothetical protein ACWEPN_20895 [Nonomuraea wenchangensis]